MKPCTKLPDGLCHRAVPQPVADQGAEIIERYLNRHGVNRAAHLPAQAKVDMRRELKAYLAVELPAAWNPVMTRREAYLEYMGMAEDDIKDMGRSAVNWARSLPAWFRKLPRRAVSGITELFREAAEDLGYLKDDLVESASIRWSLMKARLRR